MYPTTISKITNPPIIILFIITTVYADVSYRPLSLFAHFHLCLLCRGRHHKSTSKSLIAWLKGFWSLGRCWNHFSKRKGGRHLTAAPQSGATNSASTAIGPRALSRTRVKVRTLRIPVI